MKSLVRLERNGCIIRSISDSDRRAMNITLTTKGEQAAEQVPRSTMVKYMGEGSGIKGVLLAFFIGSAAAGPLYGAFPVAAVFMKKGVKFLNVLIFLGAWSSTKIPMFLFELESLGIKFAITRLLVDIPGIIFMAYLLTKVIPKKEVEEIYKNSKNLE
ncbi:hypothetical protein [Clostridium sp. E02]|uniref:hypothetical protein n=1 Tax=Clostridium sp. E02 TaxID=2487134 RepID=UPI001FA956DB|nr:hypothetical protein [Clostridium sp. E02]